MKIGGSRKTSVALFGAWLTAVVAGLAQVAAYATTPGKRAEAPTTWPLSANSDVRRPADQPIAVLFVHPRCPCTWATLNELDRALARTESAVVIAVYRDPEWPQSTAMSNRAARISGATVVDDVDGRLAEQFGVQTSGQVLVYSAERELVFTGGVTMARGHEGRNDWSEAVAAALRGASPTDGCKESPVFGCALCDPEGRS